MEHSPLEANSHSASQGIPRLLWTRRFITVFTTARQSSLSWVRWIQSTTCLRSIIILSFHLRLGLPNVRFPSGIQTKISHAFLISPIICACLAHGVKEYGIWSTPNSTDHNSWEANTRSTSEEISFLLWSPKERHQVHNSPPLDPILSQLNPVRLIYSYLPKVHLNVILPPPPRSSQWSLAFGPPNQNPVNTSPLPHTCHMSHPLHPP
jgi:hypothetical protein